MKWNLLSFIPASSCHSNHWRSQKFLLGQNGKEIDAILITFSAT